MGAPGASPLGARDSIFSNSESRRPTSTLSGPCRLASTKPRRSARPAQRRHPERAARRTPVFAFSRHSGSRTSRSRISVLSLHVILSRRRRIPASDPCTGAGCLSIAPLSQPSTKSGCPTSRRDVGSQNYRTHPTLATLHKSGAPHLVEMWVRRTIELTPPSQPFTNRVPHISREMWVRRTIELTPPSQPSTNWVPHIS